MGNIHDCVEVAPLVPQGNLMPFHCHSTIVLVVLAMPKSLFVHYLGYGLGTNVALCDQHVRSDNFLVFALNFLFKPCMVSLESIHINVNARRASFASGGTRVQSCRWSDFGAFPKATKVSLKSFVLFGQA
jgi:hypothetical protein